MKPHHATYTVLEAAKLLRIGRSTLYDAVARGDVPNAGLGKGKSVRIPAWFIDERIRRCRSDHAGRL